MGRAAQPLTGASEGGSMYLADKAAVLLVRASLAASSCVAVCLGRSSTRCWPLVPVVPGCQTEISFALLWLPSLVLEKAARASCGVNAESWWQGVGSRAQGLQRCVCNALRR